MLFRVLYNENISSALALATECIENIPLEQCPLFLRACWCMLNAYKSLFQSGPDMSSPSPTLGRMYVLQHSCINIGINFNSHTSNKPSRTDQVISMNSGPNARMRSMRSRRFCRPCFEGLMGKLPYLSWSYHPPEQSEEESTRTTTKSCLPLRTCRFSVWFSYLGWSWQSRAIRKEEGYKSQVYGNGRKWWEIARKIPSSYFSELYKDVGPQVPI